MRHLRHLVLCTTLFGAACSTTAPATGTLVDGLTEAPIADMRLIATTTESTARSCALFDTRTDASGAFRFDSLCKDVPYTIKAENEHLWLADRDILRAGEEGVKLTGWWAPEGQGLYRLVDGELAIIKTNADIQTETLLDGSAEVRYPGAIPDKPVRIPEDGWLVMVGPEFVKSGVIEPLIASGARRFRGPDRPGQKRVVFQMEPWSYIGVAFASDTKIEPRTVEIREKVTKEKGDRAATWIKGDAVPPGRYVVHREGSLRTTVLDFGKPLEKP